MENCEIKERIEYERTISGEQTEFPFGSDQRVLYAGRGLSFRIMTERFGCMSEPVDEAEEKPDKEDDTRENLTTEIIRHQDIIKQQRGTLKKQHVDLTQLTSEHAKNRDVVELQIVKKKRNQCEHNIEVSGGMESTLDRKLSQLKGKPSVRRVGFDLQNATLLLLQRGNTYVQNATTIRPDLADKIMKVHEATLHVHRIATRRG